MSASKHTPGPWKAYDSTETCPWPAGVFHSVGTEKGGGAKTSIVCSMIGQGDGKYDPEVTSANARLIAAAPEMFELVRKVAASSWIEGARPDLADLSEAIIDRIEGREG